MPVPSQPEIASLPPLPHWEQAPADLPGAIRQIKAALRARVAATGRTAEDVFAVVEQQIRAEVEEITAARLRGETVWPVIDYASIEAGTVPAQAQAMLRRRGCLVVRGHFDRDQALGWDRDIVDYVDSNRFFETYRGPGDDFFASVGSRPAATCAVSPSARLSRPARSGTRCSSKRSAASPTSGRVTPSGGTAT